MIGRKNVLVVSDSHSVAIQDIKARNPREILSLPYRHSVSVRYFHPSLPLLFVDSGVKGCIDCVTQKMEVRTLALFNESIRLFAVDESLLIAVSEFKFFSFCEVETTKSPRLMFHLLRFPRKSKRYLLQLFLSIVA